MDSLNAPTIERAIEIEFFKFLKENAVYDDFFISSDYTIPIAEYGTQEFYDEFNEVNKNIFTCSYMSIITTFSWSNDTTKWYNLHYEWERKARNFIIEYANNHKVQVKRYNQGLFPLPYDSNYRYIEPYIYENTNNYYYNYVSDRIYKDCPCIEFTHFFSKVAHDTFYASVFPVFLVNPEKVNLNYVDVDPETGKVSYLPFDKKDVVDDVWNSSCRRVTSIGKLLNKLDINNKIPKPTIERVSNAFSSLSCKGTLEIWPSRNISKAYFEGNYAPAVSNVNGTLWHSCMRHRECRSYLDFYKAAGTKIAVLLDENKKVMARALIWKVGKNKYYVDRIYSLTPFMYKYVINKLKKLIDFDYYKIDHLIYKADTDEIIDEEDSVGNYIIYKKRLINYKGRFPYLDTFAFYYPVLGILRSHEECYCILESTHGDQAE